MAKKRASYRRKRANPFTRRTSRRRGGSNGVNLMQIAIPSMLYGAVRQKASIMLTPITSKVPLGDISDEVVMGALGYLAAKKGSGLIKEVGRAALIIESARVGEAVINGTLWNKSTGGSNSIF